MPALGRAESLLAFLLLHRDAPQPRQRLAFLVWPDSGEEQARTNLRHPAAHPAVRRCGRAYHRCATILDRELGVEPSGATRWAYRDLLASETGERLEPGAAPAARRPPLVGHAAERAALIAAWRAAAAGAPRLVLVCGEAGIGKTQLVEELRDWCARRGALTLEARCYAAEGPLAYGPVVDWPRHPAMRPALARLDRARLTDLARMLPELLDGIPDLPAPRPQCQGGLTAVEAGLHRRGSGRSRAARDDATTAARRAHGGGRPRGRRRRGRAPAVDGRTGPTVGA